MFYGTSNEMSAIIAEAAAEVVVASDDGVAFAHLEGCGIMTVPGEHSHVVSNTFSYCISIRKYKKRSLLPYSSSAASAAAAAAASS